MADEILDRRAPTASPTAPRGAFAEVFSAFLKLGLTSFGGPIAHLGYFREELVARRRWVDDRAFADLVALCQLLPGPTSSQVGFVLGLARAGWSGALAAFLAFTLPSALLLLLFAYTTELFEGPVREGLVHGLKIVAVAVVAQAVWGMARTLCADRTHASIAVLAVALLAFVPGSAGMVGALLLGALGGFLFGAAPASPEPAHGGLVVHVPAWIAGSALAAFGVLLVLLPMAAPQSQTLAVVDGFYRAGALVFGGGHVVLPLLESAVVRSGWVSADDFLAGYGMAQAVPGPLFTFAAYLGATLSPAPNGILGAVLALSAIFLPGFLVLIGVLPFWSRLQGMTHMRSALRGASAAVVGILGAALYDPVFTSAIGGMRDLALALVAFVALMVWRAPPWIVVLVSAFIGIGLERIG